MSNSLVLDNGFPPYFGGCICPIFGQKNISSYFGPLAVKVYRGDFQGTLTLARAPRAQAKKIEKRKKKSGVFPEVPTELLRGAVFGRLYDFIILLLDRIKRNLIGWVGPHRAAPCFDRLSAPPPPLCRRRPRHLLPVPVDCWGRLLEPCSLQEDWCHVKGYTCSDCSPAPPLPLCWPRFRSAAASPSLLLIVGTLLAPPLRTKRASAPPLPRHRCGWLLWLCWDSSHSLPPHRTNRASAPPPPRIAVLDCRDSVGTPITLRRRFGPTALPLRRCRAISASDCWDSAGNPLTLRPRSPLPLRTNRASALPLPCPRCGWLLGLRWESSHSPPPLRTNRASAPPLPRHRCGWLLGLCWDSSHAPAPPLTAPAQSSLPDDYNAAGRDTPGLRSGSDLRLRWEPTALLLGRCYAFAGVDCCDFLHAPVPLSAAV